MKKKCIAIMMMTIAIILANSVMMGFNTAAEGVDEFTDTHEHWSREYVNRLAQLEIIAGYPDGRFGPEDTLKVDEFLKMTLRAIGHKVEEGMDYWAESYIKLAKDEGIIGENEFTDYRRPIRREEAAVIIVKAALKIEDAPIPNHTSYAKRRIPDYYDIGDEYKQEVLYAYSMGFITGAGDGAFLPKKTLTRGEGAAIIMRYLDKSMRRPMRPEDSEIVIVSNTFNGLTYEIYQPSKPEVIDVIRLMQSNMSKSKGFASLAYNSTDEVIFFDFYISKEGYEESTIFTDCSLIIRMAEWDLDNYFFIVSNPENTKELHRDVFVDMFKHPFGKDAEKVINDFDYFI
ncbi:MAG: S-layer homology domain-containing protein [Clostridiaceae bacterium]|nr:S-layer homology domain-containing protein [Clostridiaceae bacterium]